MTAPRDTRPIDRVGEPGLPLAERFAGTHDATAQALAVLDVHEPHAAAFLRACGGRVLYLPDGDESMCVTTGTILNTFIVTDNLEPTVLVHEVAHMATTVLPLDVYEALLKEVTCEGRFLWTLIDEAEEWEFDDEALEAAEALREEWDDLMGAFTLDDPDHDLREDDAFMMMAVLAARVAAASNPRDVPVDCRAMGYALLLSAMHDTGIPLPEGNWGHSKIGNEAIAHMAELAIAVPDSDYMDFRKILFSEAMDALPKLVSLAFEAADEAEVALDDGIPLTPTTLPNHGFLPWQAARWAAAKTGSPAILLPMSAEEAPWWDRVFTHPRIGDLIPPDRWLRLGLLDVGRECPALPSADGLTIPTTMPLRREESAPAP